MLSTIVSIAFVSVFVGLFFLTIGAIAFSNPFVQWQLILLEAALLVYILILITYLNKSYSDSVKMQKIARSLRELTEKDDKNELAAVSFKYVLAFTDINNNSSFLPPDFELKPPSDKIISRLEEQHSKLALFLQDKSNRDYIALLLDTHVNTKRFEIIYYILSILCNIASFFGYIVFPVVYFIPDEVNFRSYLPFLWHSHSNAMWCGNCIGDAAWTIDPAIAILMALLFVPWRNSVEKKITQDWKRKM